MANIVVIGGGAAGMMAAIAAAENGVEVILLEKMPTLGRKLRITGKGRCNVTNANEMKDHVKNMPGNGKFLFSAYQAFSNQDLILRLEASGVETKVERGNRVFPLSDQAEDIVQALQQNLIQNNVKIYCQKSVINIRGEDRLWQVQCTNTFYKANAVVIATGGCTYPATGSTGDGYLWAENFGHTLVPIRPCLVPLEIEEDWVRELQGLSLKNVEVSLWSKQKKLASQFGEMLFTHYGVSGPVILSLSNYLPETGGFEDEMQLRINLKPALSAEQLDQRILRDWEADSRKQLKNVMPRLLPSSLISVILDLAYLDGEKFVNQLTRQERLRLVEILQRFTLTITKARPMAEAIVTAGGISTKELYPQTMESRLCSGLFFAGEVIDVHGYTGGYNLQAAFSTGWVAGRAAAEYARKVENI